MSSETILDIDQICRVCLRGEMDMKFIFESEKNPTIDQMLSELTIYKVQRSDDLPHSICIDCLSVVLSAYKLKQQCEQSYRTLVGLMHNDKKFDTASCSLTNDFMEKCTQTDEVSMHPCERCDEKFFTFDALRLHRKNEHKGSAIICRFCSRSFDRIGNLKSHMAVFHPDTGYKSHNQCKICNRQFTRREHYRRHLRLIHKIMNDDLKISQKEVKQVETNKEKLCRKREETTNLDRENIVKTDDSELYSLWHEDNLETLTDDEDEKPLADLINNTAATSQIIEYDEIEKPLDELLNNTASSSQTIEDVLNDSLMEDNFIPEGDDSQKDSLIFNQTPTIKKNILQTPKRSRGRPAKKPYNCKYCDKTFNDTSLVQQHILEDHIQQQNFPCKICNTNFTKQDDLKNHLNIDHHHHSKKEDEEKKLNKETHANKLYQCIKCEKSFSTTNYLQKHLDNHDKKRYACKECLQDFLTREELTNHAKVEGHDKPLLCPECGLRCKTGNILTVHMRRHNGEKPFKCKFCSKGFPRMDDLRIHEKYHTGEKSHFCETCGKGFLRKYNLRIHLRVHTGEKPHKCPHCPQAFAQGNDLKAHIRRHTGERFRCEICGAAFLQAYQIRQHKLQEHDIHEIPPTQRVKKFTSPEEQEKQIKQNLKRELANT